MSEDGAPPINSLDQVLELIAELREELQDDPNLDETQRAKLEALLEYYIAITKKLRKQVSSIQGGL